MSSENIRGQIKTTGTQLVLNNDGNSTTVQAGSPAANIVLTLPAAPSGNAATLVDTNSTQTLSGKTFTAPVLGAAIATSINKVAITAPATGSTLTIAEGKTLTSSASITLAGTDGSQLSLAANLTTSGANAITLTTTGATSLTLPTSGTLATTSDKLSAFAATTSAELAGVISDETGTGALVLASSPALITPTVATSLDVPSAQAFALLASAGANNITIGGPTSTVVVAGNLEVQGTTTTLNTATLDVEDVNITINKGGTNGSANGAGLTVEKGWDASTNGTLVWDTTAKKFKMGQAGSEIELVDLSSTQALTGKTYSGLTISATTGTLTMTNSKTLSVTHTATIAGADDTGVLTLAAGAQVVGGNSNNNDIITRTATQTLTNKTLTSPSLTTPSVDVMTLDGQASAPANPSSGFYKTYVADSDGKLHILDSNGNDQAVGSGSSGRNYLSDWFDSAKDIGTVTNSLGDTLASSDRTANKTTWGSSNTSLLTIARSSSSPLRQTYSYLITEAGASAGAFIESPLFSLDAVDLGKPVTVSFDCADNAVSDDYQIYMCRYDSNDVLQERILVAGTASATSPYSARIPTGTTKLQGFFIAGSTSTDQYALRIVSNSSSAASIKVDSLYVGPEKVVQGAGISDWVIFTPTINNDNSNSTRTNAAKWRRVGDSMELQLYLPWTGAGAAATLSMVLPNSLTADSSKFSTANSTVGVSDWFDNGVGIKVGGAHLASTTTITFSIDGGIADLQGNSMANGDVLRATAIVPITGWSSNITMADRAVEEFAYNSGTWDTASDTTSFGYGPSGAAIGGALSADAVKYVQFQTPILPTDKIFLEYKNPSTNTWVDAANSIYPGVNLPSVAFGAQIYYDLVSTNQVKVYFNRYAKAGTTYNSLTGAVAWSAAGQSHWRVRKVSGGAAVGYPISPANITKSIARYTTNAAQSIDNAGSGEVIDFEDKVFDTKNNVTTGASWKFTASEAGYYRVSATVLLNNGGGWAAAEAASISIRRSGTIYSRADAYQTASHTAYVTCHIDDVVYLENGQYVDILIYQNSGGAITLFNSNDYNYISIEQVM